MEIHVPEVHIGFLRKIEDGTADAMYARKHKTRPLGKARPAFSLYSSYVASSSLSSTGLFKKNPGRIGGSPTSFNFRPIGTNETVLESLAQDAFRYVAGFFIFLVSRLFSMRKEESSDFLGEKLKKLLSPFVSVSR